MLREPNFYEQGNVAEIKKADIGSLNYILPFITPFKSYVVGATIAIVVAGAAVIAFGYNLRCFINEAFSSGALGLNNLFNMATVVLALAVASYGRYYLVSWLSEQVLARLKIHLIEKVLKAPLSWLEKHNSAQLLSQIHNHSLLVQMVIATSVPIASRNLIICIGCLVSMVGTDPKLSLITLALIPFIVGPIVYYAKVLKRYNKNHLQENEKVNTFLFEVMQNLKTIWALTAEKVTLENIERSLKKSLRLAQRRIQVRSLFTAFVIILVFTAILTIVWLGVHRIQTGEITGGDFVAFMFYASVNIATLGSFSEIYAELQRASSACESMAEIENEIDRQTEVVPEKRAIDFQGKLVLDGLSFFYRPQYPLFSGLSLTINPGDKIAIIGPSGAGKSTILSLLVKFYRPVEGSIYLDKTNISQLPSSAVRQVCRLVSQDDGLFSLSIADNIRYASPNSTLDQVISVAKQTGAHDFIMQLPNQYQTIGATLSSGQKQRLILARALLLNPPILLLDEATNSVDLEGEQKIYDFLLSEKRALIVVTHRVSVASQFNKVFSLEGGVFHMKQ